MTPYDSTIGTAAKADDGSFRGGRGRRGGRGGRGGFGGAWSNEVEAGQTLYGGTSSTAYGRTPQSPGADSAESGEAHSGAGLSPDDPLNGGAAAARGGRGRARGGRGAPVPAAPVPNCEVDGRGSAVLAKPSPSAAGVVVPPESVACWVTWQAFHQERQLLSEPGRLFGVRMPPPRSDPAVGGMLQAMTGPREDQELHCERLALLHISRALVNRVGQKGTADCHGRLRLYISHLPCVSCTAVVAQFIRFFPCMRLEMDFDEIRL